MADITINDLTNGSLTADNEWVGTGVFDKLMDAVNKNIEAQWNKNRIDGKEYANVYLGGMQSVIAQSMEYLLQEKLVEAQINKLVSDQAIAEVQSAKQIEKMDEEIDLLQTQDSEMLLNGVKQREKLDEEIDLLQTQDSEMLLNGVKQREKLDEEIDLLQTQDVSEQTNRFNAGIKVLEEAVTKNGYAGASIDSNGKVALGTRSTVEGTSNKQDKVLEAQENLYVRQKEAFDDNKYQKILEAQLNYNGMVFQDADAPDVLDVALEQKVNDVFNKLTLDRPISAMSE